MDAGTATEVNKDLNSCHEIRKSKHERLEAIENSEGPVGEVFSSLFELHFGNFLSVPSLYIMRFRSSFLRQ